MLRMSSRSTPFGLFAGCSICQIGGSTQIALPTVNEYKRHTRLDMNYLCALAKDLAQHSVIKEKIKYFPNSSIYAFGEQLRYVEY
jgi:lantibiotic biosynthesis protein